jgi:multiple sugar transport system permease protein
VSVEIAPTAQPVGEATGRRRQRRRTTAAARRTSIIGFLAPFGILFVAFYLLPIGYALYRSFFVTRREGAFGAATEAWGGLENYQRALQDSEFVDSILRMLLFGVVQVPVMLLLALAFALLLDSGVARLKRFFRLTYFAPYAVPSVIAAIMWGFLYAPNLSPVVDVLRDLGIGTDFLDSGTVLWSMANIVTWTYTGYNMLIIYAALQAIDSDLSEAARLDGANGWQIAWRIKVPIIRPALILTGVFSIIGTLQLFAEPQVLRSVTTSITSTYTPNLFAFTQASANNYNYAAAISILLALTTAALSFLFLRFVNRRQA